jgi:hypothetical protein
MGINPLGILVANGVEDKPGQDQTTPWYQYYSEPLSPSHTIYSMSHGMIRWAVRARN